LLRPDVLAFGGALEKEQSVGKDQRARKPGTDFVGYGAEVLSDHHAFVAVALQREDRQEIVERIADVRTFGGRSAGGYPVQPVEPHHVVDAQGA
jgi:hypothetical protein